MAFMSQDKKAKIAAALKAIPELKKWKYSLGVHHHSTIVMNIRSAPEDLISNIATRFREQPRYEESNVQYLESKRYHQVNIYYPENQFSGKLLETFKKIIAALNIDNHDNSDLMTDYHDVGHYVNINIGQWNKPFEVKA